MFVVTVVVVVVVNVVVAIFGDSLDWRCRVFKGKEGSSLGFRFGFGLLPPANRHFILLSLKSL